MNCPICNVSLQLGEKQGVEIDYCPKCRGLWLDRGKLEKIFERMEQQTAVKAAPAPPENRYNYYGDNGNHDGHHSDKHGSYGHHKKKGFLSDLFD